MKPLRTQKSKKSPIYEHGYRVTLIKDLARIFFVCRYCDLHKIVSPWSAPECLHWLIKGRAQFQSMWADYKPQDADDAIRHLPKKKPRVSNIDAFADEFTKPRQAEISALVSISVDSTDEFERWFNNEPNVHKDHHHRDDPIGYWLSIQKDYLTSTNLR